MTTCPVPSRTPYAKREEAVNGAKRAISTSGDRFRVYMCQCGKYHWHRMQSLDNIRK